MPSKTGVFTAQEKGFVEQMVKTGNPVYAAAIAGYKHPAARASQNLANPAIQAQIIAEETRILVEELYPASTKVLRKMLDPNEAGIPANARLLAVKIVRSEVSALAESAGGKDMSEMSAEELHAALDEAQRWLSERAKPIPPAAFD